ncbi:mannitol dehydrogenase family protein [Maricaulis sp.]|uniref:mannitol dehydrogenase family protein n=1 Tax=Maricaulis sp. TaxID=1486257 RepID=UPI002638ADC6|nr:mannitol dehydrogenase family protein [Maricaulis sp.]
MSARRLTAAELTTLPAEISRPGHDRSGPAGIVHLGLGAFHRAHQAVYFDDLMAQGETGWAIRGASLRSSRVARQLNPQGGLYTLAQRSGDDTRLRIVGSIRDVLVAPHDPGSVVAVLAQPDTVLVTLTVTEKGYHLDPGTGRLRMDDPVIAADLERPDRPVTVPGILTAGLAARRASGLRPFTVLSCDNLPENGPRTRDAVLGFARRVDPALAGWIESEGAFPASMVDRIVPATAPEDIDWLEAETGYRDEAMVKTEPFSQWVVEDKFCHRRPPLERVGVQMTEDVAGWERTKLRLLNGAHSALAYLGALAGHGRVHETMAAPGFEAFVERLWDEAEASLDTPAGFDSRAYRNALKRRFSNAALNHSLVQIAMDGSQKLPQRLLATLRDARKAGREVPAVETAIAAWMRWQFGEDERGRTFTVDDPLAADTAAAVQAGAGDARAIARALLSVGSVFGHDLQQDAGLVGRLASRLGGLTTEGAATVVRRLAR